VSPATSLESRLRRLLAADPRPAEERRGLLRLMLLLAELPPPPDPFDLHPRYGACRARFLQAAGGGDAEELEEAFAALYCELHGYEVPLTEQERQRFVGSCGYLSHMGGLSPILKAGPFLGPQSVSADFGAGNGLQGLLTLLLHPHRRCVQIELSSRLVEAGRLLQGWLGIPEERLRWVAGDITEHSPRGLDFIHLYRPLRPVGEGRRFYQRFAGELDRSARAVTIFSVADCLGPFLSRRFSLLFSDGHLSCFRSAPLTSE